MECPDVSELHILGNEECRNEFVDCPSHVHIHFADKPVPRRFARVWWDQVAVSNAVRKINPDWMIFPKGFPPYFFRMGKTRVASYIHDVGWEYYRDKAFSERKKAFPLVEWLYFTRLSVRAMKKSDLVLTHTAFNETRIQAYAPGTKVARIGIGFEGYNSTSVPIEKRKDVLTYASTFPHKRMELEIERLNSWYLQRPDAADIRIHLVGSKPDGLLLPGDYWLHHQRMPLLQLMELLRSKCRMSVYFSDYESFGMPPVESMLNGIPCVTSDLPGPRENVPSQYLFKNADEGDFIAKANAAYDGVNPFVCPEFPTWNEVARRCVAAMKAVQ